MVVDWLVLGLLPTAVALIREKPQPQIGFAYDMLAQGGTIGGPGQEPTVIFGDPYPWPWLQESHTLITALGIALLVAVIARVRRLAAHPAVSVAWPLAWVMFAASALMLRGAGAARL